MKRTYTSTYHLDGYHFWDNDEDGPLAPREVLVFRATEWQHGAEVTAIDPENKIVALYTRDTVDNEPLWRDASDSARTLAQIEFVPSGYLISTAVEVEGERQSTTPTQAPTTAGGAS